MPMPMMRVRHMRMVVNERGVTMPVAMGRTNNQFVRPMRVLVMFVVLVQVLVFDPFVLVKVVVLFAEQQGHAEAHCAHGCDIIPVE